MVTLGASTRFGTPQDTARLREMQEKLRSDEEDDKEGDEP